MLAAVFAPGCLLGRSRMREWHALGILTQGAEERLTLP